MFGSDGLEYWNGKSSVDWRHLGSDCRIYKTSGSSGCLAFFLLSSIFHHYQSFHHSFSLLSFFQLSCLILLASSHLLETIIISRLFDLFIPFEASNHSLSAASHLQFTFHSSALQLIFDPKHHRINRSSSLIIITSQWPVLSSVPSGQPSKSPASSKPPASSPSSAWFPTSSPRWSRRARLLPKSSSQHSAS